MATSTKLMEEISDMFLSCKICLELFKDPKTLVCLHTFCINCLEKHMESENLRSRFLVYNRHITCPVCRKRTDLPSGGIRKLPDNFLVSNLNDIVNRRRPSKVPPCEICHAVRSRRNEACSKCLDCSKLLCQNCVDLHTTTKVTQNHSIIDMEDEKDIECKIHPEEILRFYCEPCDECVCILCTFQEHRDHEICSFSDGFAKHKLSLDGMLDQCKGRLENVQNQIETITKCELILKDNRERIRDHAINYISQVRTMEKQLLIKVDSYFGEEIIKFLENKDQLQENYDGLHSVCNLADIIMKDKGVEMMLLKKELQGKLTSLLKPTIPEMPDGVDKEIRFIPGTVKLGHLSADFQVKGTFELTNGDIKHVPIFCVKDSQTIQNSIKECSTTMFCDVSLGCCDRGLQTENVQVCNKLSNTDRIRTKDTGVSVSSPNNTFKNTMTDHQHHRTCNIQTDAIEVYGHRTSDNVSRSDVAVNTKKTPVCDKGLQVFCDVGSAGSGICVKCCQKLKSEIDNHPFIAGNPPVIQDIIILNTGESDKDWRRKRRSFIHSRRVQTDISMATSEESLNETLSATSSSERLSESEYIMPSKRDRDSRRRAPQIRDIGLDPIVHVVDTRDIMTSTEPIQVRHYGVLATPITRICHTQTPIVTTMARSVATDYTGQKAKSTSTPIVSLMESGTTMPHISFDSKVTWTEAVPTSERATCTIVTDTTERGTDMERILSCDQGSSAYPEMKSIETNTSSVRNRDQRVQVTAAVCDSGTTPIDTTRSERGTSAARWEEPEVNKYCMVDSETVNIGAESYSIESLVSSASVSEKCDAGTETNIIMSCDKEMGTPGVISRDQWTLTTNPQYINTGVSPARPATIETGVGTTEISLMDQATYTEVVSLRDSETETVIVVADNETLTEKFGVQDAQTSVDITTDNQETNTESKLYFETGSLTEDDWIKTMFPETAAASTETNPLETFNKATNTGMTKTIDKSTSPDLELICERQQDNTHLVDSGIMPVPRQAHEQGIMFFSTSSSTDLVNIETQTSTLALYDKSVATSGDFDDYDMETFRSVDLCDAATSTESLPYIGLLSELDDVNDLIVFPGMTVDFLADSEEERIEMIDTCTSTEDLPLTEFTSHTVISPAYKMDDDIAENSLKNVSVRNDVRFVNIGVNTVHKLTFEKETSTPIRHLFSKGTMTFYIAKTDKSTNTVNRTKQLNEMNAARPSAESGVSNKIAMTQKAVMKDVCVSTDESLLDEKMVACITKLRNVSEKLQSPISKVIPGNLSGEEKTEIETRKGSSGRMSCNENMHADEMENERRKQVPDEMENERAKQAANILEQPHAILRLKENKLDVPHVRKAQPITTLKVRYQQPAPDNDYIKSKSLPRQHTTTDEQATLPLSRQSSPPSRLPLLRYNSAPDRIPSQQSTKKPGHTVDKSLLPSKIPITINQKRVDSPELGNSKLKSRQRLQLPAINESRTPSICSDSSVASCLSAASRNSDTSTASDMILDFSALKISSPPAVAAAVSTVASRKAVASVLKRTKTPEPHVVHKQSPPEMKKPRGNVGFMQKLFSKKKKTAEESEPKPRASKGKPREFPKPEPVKPKSPKPEKKRPFVYIRQRVFFIQHDTEDDIPKGERSSKNKSSKDEKRKSHESSNDSRSVSGDFESDSTLGDRDARVSCYDNL